MKVEAYRCDHCGHLYREEDIVGISGQQDAFEKLKSFPSQYTPARIRTSPAHHCVECARLNVTNPAQNETSREKDERAYQLKFDELYYSFKFNCLANVMNKRKFVNGKAVK